MCDIEHFFFSQAKKEKNKEVEEVEHEEEYLEREGEELEAGSQNDPNPEAQDSKSTVTEQKTDQEAGKKAPDVPRPTKGGKAPRYCNIFIFNMNL